MSVRIDQWLWACRMFKTRSQATKACTAGHVTLDGDTAKASKKVEPGMRVEAQCPRGRVVLEVRALGDKRLSAPLARELYIDHTPPAPPKPPPVATRERGVGRPTKRDRRRLARLLDEA